jgi:hypothetical protein
MCSFKIIINCESLLFLEADRRKWPGLATDLLGDGERYMTGDRYEVNPKVWTDYTLLNGCTERCGHFFDISQKGIDIQKLFTI